MPDNRSGNNRLVSSSRNGALVIVLTYAAFATLWILFSDLAVDLLFDDTSAILMANTLKGWLFVFITALLLYGLLHRLIGKSHDLPARPQHTFGAPFLVLSLLIIGLTAAAVAQNFLRHTARELSQLQSIAELKAREIGNWLKVRRHAAGFIQSNRYYAEQFGLWQEGDAAAGTRLQARLERFRSDNGFSAVVLLDPAGKPLWVSDNAPPHPALQLERIARLASQERSVQMVDVHIAADNRLELDFIAPLATEGPPAPIAILIADPQKELYPQLQDWPVSNLSGEALLFRQEGDSVLLINPLQPQPPPLGKPVADADPERLLSQLKAGAPSTGTPLRGLDYRGIPAVAMVHPVPGTDWQLLVKVDRTEFYDEAMRDTVWMVLAGMLALFITSVSMLLLRQRHQLEVAEDIRRSQAERLRALDLLAAIAESSEDVIYAKDRDGRYLLFNRAASRVFNTDEKEIIGRTDRDIFPPDQAKRLMETDRQILESGEARTMEETLTSGGRQRVQQTTMGPLRDVRGQVFGTFGISRDITELRRAEGAIRDSEARYRALVEQTLAGIYIIQDNRFRYVNPGFATIFGYDSPDELIDRVEATSLVSPQDTQVVLESIEQRLQGKTDTSHYTARGIRRDGSLVEVEVFGRSFEYEGQPAVIGLLLDITARKDAEERLLSQTEALRQQNEELERFNRASVGRELEMIALKKEINELAGKLGLEPPYPLHFLNEDESGMEWWP